VVFWLMVDDIAPGVISREATYQLQPHSDSFPGVISFESIRAPFELDFGRGSGMVGLDTVAISEDGNAVLHRLGEHRQWVWATLRLSREQMRSIANMITRRGLGSLQNEYTPSFRVHDGTQWVLLIRQGDRRKSSYFEALAKPLRRDSKNRSAL